MKLEIVHAGDPVLRRLARPLSSAEITGKEIQNLIKSMRMCMREAPGVGLAGLQHDVHTFDGGGIFVARHFRGGDFPSCDESSTPAMRAAGASQTAEKTR